MRILIFSKIVFVSFLFGIQTIHAQDSLTLNEQGSTSFALGMPIQIVAKNSLKSVVADFKNRATTYGIGTASLYDTYLSPLHYSGFNVRVMDETMSRTKLFDRNFYHQRVFDLELISSQNPAKNARFYSGSFNFRYGGHYVFYKNDGFRLGAGPLGDFLLGGIYSNRNGNNPVSARLSLNLNASLIASYKLKKIVLRGQFDSPFLGTIFSPEYGQSYYEMTLDDQPNIFYFASLHNQRALRAYLTVDFSIKNYPVRVGYLGNFYQTHINDLNSHNYTNSFVIGFPIETIKKKREKEKPEYLYWNH